MYKYVYGYNMDISVCSFFLTNTSGVKVWFGLTYWTEHKSGSFSVTLLKTYLQIKRTSRGWPS